MSKPQGWEPRRQGAKVDPVRPPYLALLCTGWTNRQTKTDRHGGVLFGSLVLSNPL